VPPPPVAGAAVGNGLADGLRVADGDADGLGVADGLAEGLTLALGVVTLAVPLGRIVGVTELVRPGENVAGVAEGEDPVQAETDAEASMVKVAQPTTVNLALSPVPMMVVRIYVGLLMRPVGGGPVSRPRHRKRNRGPARSLPAPAEGRSPEAPTAIKAKPMDGTNMQWPVHHWNIRLRD
jgi:hypothetical protein